MSTFSPDDNEGCLNESSYFERVMLFWKRGVKKLNSIVLNPFFIKLITDKVKWFNDSIYVSKH